ncbi:MAG TPA: hypothetical protein VKE74_27010 [Gemmataceae bacterium]|nr:hypothetical protein [Gemmataceae bacterium]
MTEAEWLACDTPSRMLFFVQRTFPDARRRLLLTSCAFYWRCSPRWIPTREKALLDATEAYADGRLGLGWYEQEVESFCDAEREHSDEILWLMNPATLLDAFSHQRESVPDTHLADLLRCIYGNPFRPVAVDPSWLTSTVVTLAEGVYLDRAFDRLPTLADALQDAGCDHPDILAHCRGDGPHVRGCWVVDLLLGKT